MGTALNVAKFVKLIASVKKLSRWVGTASLPYKIALEIAIAFGTLAKKYISRNGIYADAEIIEKNYHFLEDSTRKMNDYLVVFNRKASSILKELNWAASKLKESQTQQSFNVRLNSRMPTSNPLQRSSDWVIKHRFDPYFQKDFKKDFEDYTKMLDKIGSAVTNISKNIRGLEDHITKLQTNRDKAFLLFKQLETMDQTIRELDSAGLISIQSSVRKIFPH